MAKDDGTRPLIPTVEGLTKQVLGLLEPTYGKHIAALKLELDKHDIESILSRVRSLSKVIGKSKVHDLDGDGFQKLGDAICTEIGNIVDVRLPKKSSAYAELVAWITGAARDNRSEEHTSELQSLMRISYAVFCLTKKTYK